MTLALRREMCDSAEGILAQAPWERMDDTEVFALELSALEAYGKLLGINVKPQAFLPAAEEALRSLRGFLGGRP